MFSYVWPHLEPEVPAQEHLLSPTGAPELVAVVDHQEQHRGQEGEEDGEAHGGCERGPPVEPPLYRDI